MSKKVLDIEQMQHLQELGLKLKPSLVHYYKIINVDSGKWYLSVTNGDISGDNPIYQYIPAYTLQDILDLLPKEIRDKYYDKFVLKIEYGINHKAYYIGYYYYNVVLNDNCLFSRENLIDAAYEMLCWCVENGHVKTAK